MEICEECGSKVIEENDTYVCQKCGLILGVVQEVSASQLESSLKEDNRKKQQQVSNPKRFLCDECNSMLEVSSKRITCSKCSLVYKPVDNKLAIASSLGTSIGSINGSSTNFYYKKDDKYHIVGPKGDDADQTALEIMKQVSNQLQIPTKLQKRSIQLFHKYRTENLVKREKHVTLSALAIHLSVIETHEYPITLKEIVDEYRKLGYRVLGKNIHELMVDFGLKTSFKSVRRSEEYVFRICSLICRNKTIAKRIKKSYGLDSHVYEKILQILCLKILEVIPFSDRKNKLPYPLAGVSAYVSDKLLSRKVNRTLALTQKLVSHTTNVPLYVIRDYSKFMFSYDFDNIITEISNRLSSSFEFKS